jgi:hypothetical protein
MEWEQRETRVVETPGRNEPQGGELVGEAGGVAMQLQVELEGQKEGYEGCVTLACAI